MKKFLVFLLISMVSCNLSDAVHDFIEFIRSIEIPAWLKEKLLEILRAQGRPPAYYLCKKYMDAATCDSFFGY